MLAVGGMHVTRSPLALVHHLGLKRHIPGLVLLDRSNRSIGARIILDPMPERFGLQIRSRLQDIRQRLLEPAPEVLQRQAGTLELVIQLTP